MNPVSSCFSTTFTSAQFNYYMSVSQVLLRFFVPIYVIRRDKNNKLVYLCPGGLTCCINGRIAAPQPRLNLPSQSFSGPIGSNLMPQDSFSNDNLWAYDDSKGDPASLLTEPSNDEAYNAFLDPIEPSLDPPDSTNDWASIFNGPSEGADYLIQEQPPDNENAFLNAVAPNSYLNSPSNELSSIFIDPSEGADLPIPNQSLG